MKKPSSPRTTEDSAAESLWDRLIGLGEGSFRKNYFPELQERLDELERFRILLDHSSDVILLVHLATRQIVDINASACRQLGYPQKELLGRDIDGIFDLARLKWPEGERVFPECGLLSTTMQRSDGAQIPVEIAFSMDAFADETYLIVVVRDITQRLEAEKKLQESEIRFRSIFHSAAAGMAVVTTEGTFEQVNPALCAFLGYPEEELIGRSLLAVTHPDDRQRSHRLYREALAGKRQSFTYEKRYLRKDGSTTWGHASIALIYDTDHWPLYCIALVQDISEQKRAEEILRQSDQIKGEFISVAAHELRTPLTSVQGFAQLLLTQKDLTPEMREEFLSHIVEKSTTLTQLVEDLLDIARIEAGQKMRLNLEGCLVSWLVARLAPLIRNNAARRRIETDLKHAETLLRADGPKLVQVLENLLTNAIKYSATGSRIVIGGDIVGNEYRFAVDDEGIGMTPEQVERIFDKFYRVDDKNTAVHGLGLGMNIVRNIVRAHGGEIRVESAPGRGTTVRFSIPLPKEADK